MRVLFVVEFIYPDMPLVERLYARKCRENNRLESGERGDAVEDVGVFVGVLKPHRGGTECVFDVDDAVVAREIIIKNPPRSNDLLFFSVVRIDKAFVALRLCEAVMYEDSLV